ncbi:MAG: phosphate ABC transporter permease PstA [Acidobacteria bacterium]|nr:phosphate ABC transporter permease PstA [Acidobacteriota bacterium]MDW7984621.1 phosphate ABC transporter permease PstA [Acidobacteriota bacterium]
MRKRTIPRWRAEATPLLGLCGASLVMALLMTVAMLGLVFSYGLGLFWQKRIVHFQLRDGSRWLGEVWSRETVQDPTTGRPVRRIALHHGNRDLWGTAFRWIDEADVVRQEYPPDAVRIERLAWGPAFGQPRRVWAGDRPLIDPVDVRDPVWQELFASVHQDRRVLQDVEGQIDAVNDRLERVRRRELRLRHRSVSDPSAWAALQAEKARWEGVYGILALRRAALMERLQQYVLEVAIADGTALRIPLAQIVTVIPANRMSLGERIRLYAQRYWALITENPREANTEGGIFPAIFGTVSMVLIMSLAVVPVGVMTALYLREYARQSWLTRVIRIAVNNLAAVPSIVYGVFGMGFFIYTIGTAIDQTFYPWMAPTPVFGTGGLLWASLTLALLTVPVVIVATEEALLAIQPEIRHGARALGATQWQTVRHVILPAATPGVLTGLILAIARATGEVAPLMLTGVVKLAPDLPIDDRFPFIHLERKFMHLGFHIYDVGFQSPNVDAAQPMVYNTTLLLLVIVVVLNLTAIHLRNRVRRLYHQGAL